MRVSRAARPPARAESGGEEGDDTAREELAEHDEEEQPIPITVAIAEKERNPSSSFPSAMYPRRSG